MSEPSPAPRPWQPPGDLLDALAELLTQQEPPPRLVTPDDAASGPPAAEDAPGRAKKSLRGNNPLF